MLPGAGFEIDQALANIIARLSGSSVIFRTSTNTPGGIANIVKNLLYLIVDDERINEQFKGMEKNHVPTAAQNRLIKQLLPLYPDIRHL